MTTKKIKPKKEVFTYLDLGCGQNKCSVQQLHEHSIIPIERIENAVVLGVDMYPCEGVDKVWDLTKFPYPFKDNSIDGAFSSHFVEHLDGPERIKFFNEMYRILKVGARMRHIHPHYRSVRAVQDPTHKWPPIAPESYWYWDKNFREANKLGHYLGNCDFEIVVYNSGFTDQSWATKNKETQAFAAKHYNDVIPDLIADMVKR
jgi:hypothetical protein